jgi:site-specific recombinase XerD
LGGSWDVPGAAPLLLVEGSTRLLRPDEQIFEAMLEGWANQQLARALKRSTIEPRVRLVRRFQRYTNDYPWNWHPSDVEDFIASRASRDRPVALSTIRSDAAAIRAFCDYVTDARYQWVAACQRLFGDVPAQICFEWNTSAHVSEYEGRPERRAMTKAELQALFDLMDDMVATQHAVGSKSWLTTLRDAAAFKTAYAFGLRRRELVMLELADFGRNPHAAEFGDLGVLYVRWGKANRGGAPKKRSVLTVFPWSVSVLREWIDEHRILMSTSARSTALWPSERSGRMGIASMGKRFAFYRAQAGLPEELGMHCLRHSYVTHLIEGGWDPLFVQQQVGHSHAATTGLYTWVSSDFRNKRLRAALDNTIRQALAPTEGNDR